MARSSTTGTTKRVGRKRISESPTADTIDVKPRASTRKVRAASTRSTRMSIDSDTVAKRNRSASQLSGQQSSLLEQDVLMPDAPLHDASIDDDEAVEEYDFSNDPEYVAEAEEDDQNDDTRSVISLSSEPSIGEGASYPVDRRPWLKFSESTRKDWETMYSNVTPYAINGDWSRTEAYQREKDHEMLRYLDDFPLPTWVIPTQQASNAYFQLMERMKWRNYGIPIYGRDRVPALSPDTAPPHQAFHAAPPPSRNMRGPPPGPGPSQHMQPSHYHTHPQGLPQHMIQNVHHQPMPPQHVPAHLANQQVPSHVPSQQYMGPVPHPNRGQFPPGLLPSQPYAQPIPVQNGAPPPGFGRPVGPPQSIPYGVPLGTYVGHPVPSPYGPPMPVPGQASGPPPPKPPKKQREKKETPVTGTPPPPAPTPPYAVRTKPAEMQNKPKRQPRASNSKNGKRPVRRQAEAEEFPWTRQMNFPEEKERAKWDDTIYDPATLNAMANVRAHNIPLMDTIDARLQEMQRLARIAKKAGSSGQDKTKTDPSADAEAKPKEKKKRGQNKNDAGDHSGGYSWANSASEKLGRKMGFALPEDAIDAGMADRLDDVSMAQLNICWNPGKKGVTEGLQQAIFSVRDSVVTRKQLDNTPILTRRAAECIVDFCPELLWRGLLLRVCSEGGYGNKDVRDRFCFNGCYCDKATITKRISAALGQKQVVPKSKGYQAGELEWYDENVKDFTCYIEYFGRRTGHRNLLKIQMQSDKRLAAHKKRIEQAGSELASPGEGPSSKGRKPGAGGGHTSEDMEGEDTESDGEGEESEENDDDAVSAQDSDILDAMSDSD
ncbi:hypothetical protein Slin15195_G008450 [Septoria linicola]|uniref:Uncharacterized protein n=1 Tax=Septoria linicola TaxID=215465 RepID=A0A9Q9AKC2_9PEZI|nr:hypothetical protein Slin14017_G008460 [Septoria linicola]USW47526.1 hypothetical protein Slin15195_G008450 [Septoria linicola]